MLLRGPFPSKIPLLLPDIHFTGRSKQFPFRLPKCPRVPSHISWELEEIYKKGPVEAAVKLVKNTLEVQKPAAAQKPAASQLPSSAAGPADR